jgi:hypothetical protein
MIRRDPSYGPLPGGTCDNDGQARGILFAFVDAHLERQFEFMQAQWVSGGKFGGASAKRDPLVRQGDDTTVTYLASRSTTTTAATPTSRSLRR